MAYTKSKLMKMRKVELEAIASAAGIDLAKDATKSMLSDAILIMGVGEGTKRMQPNITAPDGVSVRIARIQKANQ